MHLVSRPAPGLCLLMSVGLTACGSEALHIESDTSWAGAIEGAPVTGRGSQVIDLDAFKAGTKCWTLRKTTSAGVLHVWGEQKSLFGLGVEIFGESTTREPGGVVQGCVP